MPTTAVSERSRLSIGNISLVFQHLIALDSLRPLIQTMLANGRLVVAFSTVMTVLG